jgi:hypothetical protein
MFKEYNTLPTLLKSNDVKTNSTFQTSSENDRVTRKKLSTFTVEITELNLTQNSLVYSQKVKNELNFKNVQG